MLVPLGSASFVAIKYPFMPVFCFSSSAITIIFSLAFGFSNSSLIIGDAKREEESFSDAIERLLKKDKVNLSEYFGALKEDPILDRLEADSKRIREMARSRV